MQIGDALAKCTDYWDGIEKYVVKDTKNIESLGNLYRNLKTSFLSFGSVHHHPVELFKNNLFTIMRNTRKQMEQIDDVFQLLILDAGA